jgi:serpin B
MKKAFAFLFVSIMILGLFGCTKPIQTVTPTSTIPTTTIPTGASVSFQIVKADEPRITSPNVSSNDLLALVKGNTNFAFDLYQKLKKNSTGNMFYSPYSISTALAMTYAGARSDTEKQMGDTLHFTLPQTQLHPAFNKLAIELASRGQGAQGKEGKSFSLNITNDLWGQNDYNVQPDFLKTLAQNYGVGMNILDFINSPEESRITINEWISDRTNNRIKDLLPQGSVNTLTRLVLTNAIYFDAAWQYPFAKESTRNGDFHLLDGSTITVPMMSHRAGFGYAKGNGYQAVELPYDGKEISMVILLPDAGKFTTFENSMDFAKVSDIIDNLKTGDVDLTMPKFRFESSFSLKSSLASMGMPIAFSDQADFSGITGNKELTITDVIHKAFVAVDEAGTEAAAASGVVVGVVSIGTVVTVDQPFIFLIRDIETGTILFVGRVLNPGS